MAKAEQLEGKENARFVVTSLSADEWPAQRFYEQMYCAPSLVTAQQAGGELSLQGASLGPVARGYDINREANIQAYVDLLEDVR